MVRRLALCLLAVAAAAALAGCGNRVEVRTLAETEGIYIDIGELKYQVQLSRILNPDDLEDRAYFVGLPEGEEASADEAWFAIFLRVENTTGETHPAAEDFEIVDTQENTFEPLALENNLFAYEPESLAPKALIPHPDSVAGEGVIQGSLLLFKVSVDALQNRPLEFRIKSPESPDQVGIVDLDV